MKQQLLDLDRALLAAAGMRPTPDGYINIHIGETKEAFVKSQGVNKRLVLPTVEHLKNPDWKNRVVFHPLAENMLNGESEVLRHYRKVMVQHANYVIGLLGYQLLTIATSNGEHAKLSPDQSEFLSLVKEADEKTLGFFEKILESMTEDQATRAFVNIYLKRSGKVGGVAHNRVGVVSFPLYEELSKLEKGNYTVYGVKMRARDVGIFKALLEYIIPSIKDTNEHVRGSMSRVAPYLDALMKALQVFAAPINDVVDLFRNRLEDPEELTFNAEWVDSFVNVDDLAGLARSVPMLPGNEGAAADAPVVAEVAATPATVHRTITPQPVAPQQAAYQQLAVQAGPPKTADGKIDLAAVLRSNPQARQQMGFPAPGYGGYQQMMPSGPPPAAFDRGPAPYNVNGRPSWGGGTSAAWGATAGTSFGRL